MSLLLARFASIRTKIILPYLLLALALATTAGYVAWQIASDSVQERFINQLIEVGKLANEGMVRQEDQILEALRLLANTSDVPQAIQNQDSSTLRNLALPIAVNTQEDAIIFLTIEGNSILSMYHTPGGLVEEYTSTQGDSEIRSWNIVQLVIQNFGDERGDKFAAYHDTPYGVYFFICGPVLDENQSLVGAIMIGRSVKRITQEIREETLAQITVYNTLGQPIESTFIEKPALDPLISLDVFNNNTESVIRTLEISDIQYSEILGTWNARGENLGVLGASFSQNFLIRMSSSTWPKLLILIIISTCLIIIVGIFLSNIISQPIRQLEKAVLLIGEGDLDVQVILSGSDEIAHLAQEFNSMVKRLQQTRKDLMAAYDSTIEGWAKTLETRDREVLGHSHRVVKLTLKLANAIDYPEEEMVHLRRGAFLHDIGKLAIPEKILNKPGPLTKDEWKIIKKHPKFAYDFLIDIEYLEKAINIPYCHHESWDGNGYPRGLKGEEIPLEARIFTIVDVFDAVISKRPYKKARSVKEALMIIEEGKGKNFDPQVVDVFLQIMRVDGNESEK